MLHLSSTSRACCCIRQLHRARALHLSTLLPSKNHYEALRVSRNASRKEIKSAFVTLSKTYHPDLNPELENAKKLFVEINEAYSVLGNPAKRRRYDLELHTLEVYQSQYRTRQYAGNHPREAPILGLEIHTPIPLHMISTVSIKAIATRMVLTGKSTRGPTGGLVTAV